VNEPGRKEAVMKTITLSVAVVALFLSGCSREHTGLPVPSEPSPLPAPAPPPPPPSPQPPPPGSLFSEVYSEVTVGQVVHGRPTPNDPECVAVPGFTCQHFRVTPATDGTLTVVITFSHDPLRQVLDLSAMSAEGWTVWANHDALEMGITRGRTYEITVWYLTPGVEFELRTSLN
jgi:hypothetical protein